MSQELQAAFEASLDRVQRGEASLDQVLRDYPEMAADLRELLVVALDLQAMTPPPMTPAEMNRGLALIDQELQRRAAAPPRPITSLWDRLIPRLPPLAPVRLAGVVAAVAVALVAYGGVTLAAVNSGPGSALYGYRLSLEELRVAFVDEDDRAALYLEHAEARLREIEQTAPAGDRTAVQHAIDAYRDSLRKGVSALSIASAAAGPADREDAAAVVADFRSRLRDHQTRLQGLTEASAPDVREPIAVASQSADEGLLDARRGPNLALLPTATPGVVAESAELPTPSPAPAATAAPAPPPPTAAPSPSPAPTAPPPATTATPAAETPAPSPAPTETSPPSSDQVAVAEQQTVLVGRLDAQDDARLLVSGIAVRLPGADEPAAQVDLAIAIGDWVQVVAVLDSDGQLRLVNLGHAPTPEATPTPEPTASPTPEATATPEPTETPDPTETPTPESTASPTPEATATPEPTETATPEPRHAGDYGPRRRRSRRRPRRLPRLNPRRRRRPRPPPRRSRPQPRPPPRLRRKATPRLNPDGDAHAGADRDPGSDRDPSGDPDARAHRPAPDADGDAGTNRASPTPEATPEPTETPAPETTPTPEPTHVSPEPTPDDGESKVEVERLATLRGIVQSVEENVLRVGGVEFRIPDDPADLVPDGVEPGAVVRVAYRVDATNPDDPLLVVVMVELIAPATQDAAEAGSGSLPPPAG